MGSILCLIADIILFPIGGVRTVKLVVKGVTYLVKAFKGKGCEKQCPNGVAKIVSCEEDELAICECEKCGKPFTRCFDADKICDDDRRRLLDDDDFTDVIECLNNDVCTEVLFGYGYEGIGRIQSTTDRCNEYACTDEVLKLFENAVDEVIVNVPTSADDICNGFYEYIDDGDKKTFEQAQMYCEQMFSADLALIETKEQYDCAISTIGNGSPPWVALDLYSDGQNTRSTYFYDIEHISCNKPLTAVLCNYKDSVCEIDEIQFKAASIPNHVDFNSKNIFESSDSVSSLIPVICFVGFILFLLVTYVFGCYYCVCGKHYKTKTKEMEKYDIVDVVDE